MRDITRGDCKDFSSAANFGRYALAQFAGGGNQKMRGIARSVVVAIPLLYGCSTTELQPGADTVRVISERDSAACKFVAPIHTINSNTLTKEPLQDATNKAKNQAASAGGDALRIISTDTKPSPSGIGYTVVLTGEAYRCAAAELNTPTRSAAPANPSADEVRLVQQKLKERGFDPGSIDGIMGARTRGAIRDFQRSEGLPPDGRITADLYAKLGI